MSCETYADWLGYFLVDCRLDPRRRYRLNFLDGTGVAGTPAEAAAYCERRFRVLPRDSFELEEIEEYTEGGGSKDSAVAAVEMGEAGAPRLVPLAVIQTAARDPHADQRFPEDFTGTLLPHHSEVWRARANFFFSEHGYAGDWLFAVIWFRVTAETPPTREMAIFIKHPAQLSPTEVEEILTEYFRNRLQPMAEWRELMAQNAVFSEDGLKIFFVPHEELDASDSAEEGESGMWLLGHVTKDGSLVTV